MTKQPKTNKLMNRSLMHTAAKLHYVDGVSQLEISQRMQVSTASVSRLLARARDEGIVQIQVIDIDDTDEIGVKLCSALQLRAARVLESGNAAGMSSHVGSLLIDADLRAGSVIAVGWGRTIQGVISAGLPRIPNVIVVPAMGGMNETTSHFQINEFVRTAAEQMHGNAKLLYAPSLPSPELHSVLMRDPAISRIVDYWSKVDVALMGIGDFQHSNTNRDLGLGNLDAGRVVGDVARHYYDENGMDIDWPGHDNLVAINRDQLRRIPLSIGVATGKEKIKSIVGAARAKMINALVTDTRTARLMLEHLQDPA